jgi:hypothetical protein
MRRKITIKELKDYLRNKNCKRSNAQYAAEVILGNPGHPIAQQGEDFRMSKIFDHETRNSSSEH